MPPLIGSILLTPSSPKAGESTLVQVLSPSGKRYVEADGVLVTINGIHAPYSYMSWRRPGKQRLSVLARQAGLIDQKTLIVEIQPAEPGSPLYRLQVRRFSNKTSFQFETGPLWRHEQRRARSKEGTHPSPAGQLPPAVAQGVHPQLGAAQQVAYTVEGIQPSTPTYEWDFGDGTKVSTEAPKIFHDFTEALDPNRIYAAFTVTLKVLVQGIEKATLRRTVPVINLYALSRKRGIFRPPVSAGWNGVLNKGMMTGGLTVWNPETSALNLTARRIEAFFAQANKEPVLLPQEHCGITLLGRRSTVVRTEIPIKQLPENAVAFAVHYFGLVGNQPVYVSAWYDIPLRWHKAGFRVRNDLATTITPVIKRFRRDVPLVISDLEEAMVTQTVKRQMVAEPKKDARVLPFHLNAIPNPGQTPMIGHLDPLPVMEGAACDPSNLPDKIPDGFACQATGEIVQVELPGRFMNAKKGDIVLSAAGTSLIAQMMLHVEPPQLYSHCGIMTRNLDEITHSTAAENRLPDYPVGSFLSSEGAFDGVRPDVLKYLWPGVITQQVELAVNGEQMSDPETGKAYSLRGFNPDQASVDNFQDPYAFPLVVKPPLAAEAANADIRNKLHKIADFAIQQAGKSHYRFFCYTDPTIVDTDTAPSDAGWASGTYPTVCSSFVWHCVRKTATHFEGMTEAKIDDGWKSAPGNKDGLYVYTAKERLSAGNFLYDEMATLVENKADEEGFFGGIAASIEDAADDFANQVLNAFASDWCDTNAKDSDDWKDTSDASAVSPDDILHWDTPSGGGLYGFSEPLVYRPRRIENVAITRWKKVQQFGSIKGRVLFKNAPVALADVQLSDGSERFTDASGSFSFEKVPVGHYQITASRVLSDKEHDKELYGFRLSNDLVPLLKQVNANVATQVEIELEGPDERYRAIMLDGWHTTVDYEFNAAVDPRKVTDLYRIFRLGPETPTAEHTYVTIADGDVRSEFHVRLDLVQNKTVKFTFTLRLFDGPDSDDDVEASVTRSFEIPPGKTKSWEGMKCKSGGDTADVELTVHNGVQST